MTTLLTGMLPAVVLIAAALTAVTSAVLLWLYRRATLRSMQRSAGAAPSPAAGSIVRNTPEVTRRQLDIINLTSEAPPGGGSAAYVPYRQAAVSLRRAGFAHAAGGAAYALLMATPWMIAAGDGFVPARFVWLFACYLWPAALVLGIVIATTRREWLLILCVYFSMIAGAALYVLSRNPESNAGELVYFWLFANAPGTLLLIAFLRRRVRAVGPLVLAFMVAGVAGAMLIVEALRRSDPVLRVIVAAADTVDLGPVTVFILIQLAGFALLGLAGWLLLGWIGRRYRAKRLSDESIVVGSMWLLFAVVQSITYAFEGWAWIFTGIVAFVACRSITRAGFSLFENRHTREGDAPVLLLLRVFALGRRSEQFFASFSKWWRRLGSVTLIAGPDLVTTSVEPHEFLDFISGRLSRQFVQGADDLQRRLDRLDTEPDLDGRYRVNEFFCHADTWQMTMRELARNSTVVMMDLRSFSPANRGCVYELERLLDSIELDRVLLLVDDTTDHEYLGAQLRSAWQTVGAESPNTHLVSPGVRLFHVADRSRGSIRRLFGHLLGHGSPVRRDRHAAARKDLPPATRQSSR